VPPVERRPYEWAVIRIVPRVERGEFVNAGVVVYCRQDDFLGASTLLDEDRLRALWPDLDTEVVGRHLDSLAAVCAGDPLQGENGRRSAGDRFRWLVAPRSTVVQLSPVHTGVTADPAFELRRLLTAMVARQQPSSDL
jgi:hypothetical protein